MEGLDFSMRKTWSTCEWLKATSDLEIDNFWYVGVFTDVFFQSEVIWPSGTVLLRTSRSGVSRGNILSPWATFLYTLCCLTCNPCKRDGDPL